tara:strand:+ start:420 stop:623 length:204 start_codon:yes stop_codon:yes gene_type:complete
MLKESKKHLNYVNMTYWSHFVYASKVIFKLKKIELVLFTHMLLPAYFKNYASKQIFALAKQMEEKKQ